MTETKQRVYSWGSFVAFVHEATGYSSQDTAHPIVDVVAKELRDGSLTRRSSLGYPITAWSTPADLLKSYLHPEDVNQRPIMKTWRLEWAPQTAEKSNEPTVAQQVQSLGWKAALQIEATRLWKEQKILGVKPVLKTIAELLHQFALKHQIKGDRGITPSAEYIRSHVISRRAWTRPL